MSSESDIAQIWKEKLQPGVTSLLRGEPSSGSSYTTQIRAVAPEHNGAVPYYYDTQWDIFSRGVVVVDRLFAYLNRDYVKRETDVGKDVKTVGEIALDQWKTNVFGPLAPRLEEVLGTDSPCIAAIRAKFSFKNVTAEDFAAVRIREIPAASA
ncbi:hypothetical protein C8R47DRAFT_1225904 [Mycena vitilis]|nr:hypothetical protein C8R47DRAFT_1225904 [Mycena vitilis]